MSKLVAWSTEETISMGILNIKPVYRIPIPEDLTDEQRKDLEILVDAHNWSLDLMDKFKEGNVDDALDLLYSHVDNLHCNGKFKESDYILVCFLQEGDFLKEHYMCGLGLLSITKPARKELKYREQFFYFFEGISLTVKGAEETEAILKGLHGLEDITVCDFFDEQKEEE